MDAEGIEFNWPQHHRPTIYMPVDFDVIELADGGQAVRCHDFDRLSGTEVVTMIGLHPGLAAIVISALVQWFSASAIFPVVGKPCRSGQ